MLPIRFRALVLALSLVVRGHYCLAQDDAALKRSTDVIARMASNARRAKDKLPRIPPAVIWLKPVNSPGRESQTRGSFTLLQKNKMFSPHLLVVPVGSSVTFPNADPFFHNVFSLFDGRRFDLGLYEAGSTRSVVFSREGVSYIFCNIHSEMSAVVISLSTPFYSIANQQGAFHIQGLSPGDYDLHIWIEGQRQGSLDRMTRRIHIGERTSDLPLDLGEIYADTVDHTQHLNKFGKPYEPDPNSIY